MPFNDTVKYLSEKEVRKIWKDAYLKSQRIKKPCRIRTYLNKNKWWILGIVLLSACLFWTVAEIYIGFALGVY